MLSHPSRRPPKNTQPRRRARRGRTYSRLARLEQLENRLLLTTHQTEPPEFVAGEILVGFEGEVAATFANRGASAALQAAGRQVGGLGLNTPVVLFELLGTEHHSARLATRWQLAGNADVLSPTTKSPAVASGETEAKIASPRATLTNSN